jgi:probable phosphoglycerate mutase
VHVIVEADGGSRGNPGPTGYGALVRDPETGQVLAERKAGLGSTTNNVAEYSGLVAGLKAADELGADSVDVRMDSKLVVEQMSGRWKIRNETLRPLAAEAKQVCAHFSGVSYEWVPRARNKDADRLANEAMDAQEGSGQPGARPESRPSAVASPPARETARTAPPAAWSGATGPATRLLLVRHGQTGFSVARRYSGRGDPELTEVGVRQAEALGKRLAGYPGLDAVLCSPLRRASHTARLVAEPSRLPVEVLDGLTETDFGRWEGLTFAEAAEAYPEQHRTWLCDPGVATPGGESFDAVYRRVETVRDELLRRHAGETVAVVSHVTPIKSLLRMGLAAGPSVLYRLHLDLASLSIVEFYPDGNSSVLLVNDTSHLR